MARMSSSATKKKKSSKKKMSFKRRSVGISLLVVGVLVLAGIILFHKGIITSFSVNSLPKPGFVSASGSGIRLVSKSNVYQPPLFFSPYSQNGYDFQSNGTSYNFYIKNNSNYGDGTRFCANDTNNQTYCFVYQPEDMSYRNQVGSQDYLSSVQSVVGSPDNGTFTYPSVFPNTNLTYFLEGREVKEDYILKSLPHAPQSYLGSNVTLDYGGYINYGNLSVFVNGTNKTGQDFVTSEQIDFVNPSGETVYSLPKPRAVDSNGSEIDLEYEVHNQSGQIWFYTRTPYSWLNDSSRVYPVYVDPTYIQKSSLYKSSSTKTNFNLTFSSLPSAGDTIVVFVTSWNGAGTVTVSDYQGNGNYTELANNTGGTSNAYLFYKKNISVSGGTFIVHVHFSSAAYPDAVAAEFSGIDNSNPVDSAVTKTNSSSGTHNISITSDNPTTSSNDLIVAMATGDGSGNDVWTHPTGYTIIANQNDGGNMYNPLMADYKIDTTTETPHANWSWTNQSLQSAAIIAGFKGSSGDTTPPTYSLNSTNSTYAGQPVKHRLYWTDDVALSGYIFSFDNGSGTFTNDSWIPFTGTNNWSNVTKVVNSTVGSTIRWKVYANDSSNNWNVSQTYIYNTTAYFVSWCDSSVDKRINITFNNSASSENLIDFPVLVVLSPSRINYANTQNQGQDIRFCNGGTSEKLDYEIEKWNSSGDSYIWVKVPQIDAGSTTDYIQMYYKNNTAVSDGQNAPGVWSNGYVGVWHLSNGSTLNTNDSTIYGNNGTNNGVTAGKGPIDGDGIFNGSSYINAGDGSSPALGDNLTLTAWVNVTNVSTYRGIVSKTHGYFFSVRQTTGLLGFENSHSAITSNTPLSLGSLYYAAVTYNGTNVSFYLNGASDGGGSEPVDSPGTNNLLIGTYTSSLYRFAGQIDEIRISDVPRSQSWVHAQYLSQNDSFNTYSSSESLSQGITPTVCVKETGYCFSTIQAAINNATANQTVVIINNATYNENITIDKNLNLTSNSTTGMPTIYGDNVSTISLNMSTTTLNLSNINISAAGDASGLTLINPGSDSHIYTNNVDIWVNLSGSNSGILLEYGGDGASPIWNFKNTNITIINATKGFSLWESGATLSLESVRIEGQTPSSGEFLQTNSIPTYSIDNSFLNQTGAGMPIVFYNKPINITNSKIYSTTNDAIYCGTTVNNIQIINDTVQSTSGVTVQFSGNATLKNDTLRSISGKVILSGNPSNFTISDSNISSSTGNLVATGGYGAKNTTIQAINNIFSTGATYSITVNGWSSSYNATVNLTFVNSTIDPSDITVSAFSAGDILNVTFQKYLNVNVTDTSFIPISGALVNVSDINNNLIFSNITNSSGLIPQQNITYVKLNSSGSNTPTETYLTNHTINVTKSGYNENGTSVNMSTNQNVLVTLGTATDTTAPQMSFVNPTPSNGATTSNTSIPINVSISEPNLENVTYNWNGTNYTIYNNSLVLMMNFDNRSSLGENNTHIVDLSRYGNNGTASGGAVPIANGKYGGAFSFDGAGGYINLGQPNMNITNGISLAAWVKTNSSSNDRIISKHNTTSGNYGWMLGSLNSGFEWRISTTGTDWNGGSTSSGSFPVGQWVYVVATYNGSDMNIYIDGKEDTGGSFPVPLSGDVHNSTSPLRIGRDDTTHYLNGSIDDVQIWNRSLSASEIQQLYMSNLEKYNSTQWNLYVNQSKNTTSGLDPGTYKYQAFATDSSSNSNSTEQRNITIENAVDTIPPTVILDQPNNTYNISSTTIIFNSTASDNVGLANLSIYGNWTGSWAANITNSSPLNNTLTQFLISNLSEGTYKWNAYACDSSGNCAFSNTNRTFTVDTTAPIFTTIPSNDTITYPENWAGVDFDASDSGIGLNASSWTLNNSKFVINSTGYLDNTSALAAGIYVINVSVEDYLGNQNYTIYKLTVNKGTLAGALTSTKGFSYTYDDSPTTINISESNPGSSDVNYTIYRDGVYVGEGSENLAAGTYNYVLNSTGGQNYTSNSSIDTKTLTVGKATPLGEITGNSPITNTTQTDIQGIESNQGGSDLTYNLYRNGTLVSNPDVEYLSIGTYGYIYNTTGGQNYTSSSSLATFTLVVQATPSASPISSWLGGSHLRLFGNAKWSF